MTAKTRLNYIEPTGRMAYNTLQATTMTKTLFIVPAIAIIAAETVCGLCNLCDSNMSAASCDDIIIPGETITADGHTVPLSAAADNSKAADTPDNATGWLLWHIK